MQNPWYVDAYTTWTAAGKVKRKELAERMAASIEA